MMGISAVDLDGVREIHAGERTSGAVRDLDTLAEPQPTLNNHVREDAADSGDRLGSGRFEIGEENSLVVLEFRSAAALVKEIAVH